MTKTTSLKLSQELRELGYEVESEKSWAEYRHGLDQPDWKWEVTNSAYDKFGDYEEYRNMFPAYSMSELWEGMPDKESGYKILVSKSADETFVRLFRLKSSENEMPVSIYSHHSPTEALGLMKKYLLVNGIS